ncbi:MAG: zinc metallopeptidase [Pseudomonadota bacterium]
MHPAVILIPVAAVILGPRIWVARVLKQHNHEDESLSDSAADLARAWLDAHQLQLVKVEITDLGDHYDPKAKAVRLTRDKFDRKSLTAVTTAAHEVSHALQDAADYAPFVWRTRLASLAQASGQVGTVILLSVPAAALFFRRPIPPVLIGATLFGMLGTGLALQLTALQSELDASFKRALPMLQDGAINTSRVQDAKKILIACSLTYVASSILSVLNIWPWLGAGGALRAHSLQPGMTAFAAYPQRSGIQHDVGREQTQEVRLEGYKSRSTGTADKLIRSVGKPLIRTWFRLKGYLG